MSQTWLQALAPKPGCLSELDIAEQADRGAAADLSHIATCEACATRLREHRALREAATYEPVPAALSAAARARPRRRPRFAWQALLGAGMATALAVFLMVPGVLQKEPESAWTQKGSAGVYATVMRGDVLLEDDTLLSTVAPLHPADRLRLRVAGGVASVTLSTWEQSVWQELYAGPVDDEGWLPGSITLTDTGATRLRLVVCAQARSPSSCTEQTFNL